MGAWFAKFLETHGYQVLISDKKRPETHKLTRNKFQNASKEEQITGISDVILFATPTRLTRTLLGKIAAQAPRTTLLVEISSIKEPVKATIRILSRKGTQVLSIHPMFGPGAKNLQGKTVIITHKPRHSPHADKFISTLRSAGTEIVFCNLERHDRIVAATLALPHLVNCALIETLRRTGYSIDELKRLGGTTFKLQVLIAEAIYHESAENEASILADTKSSEKLFRAYLRQADEIVHMIREKRRPQLTSRLRNDLPYLRRDKSFKTAYGRFVTAVEASNHS